MRGSLFCFRYGDIEKKGSRIQGAGRAGESTAGKKKTQGKKKKDEIGDEERQQS